MSITPNMNMPAPVPASTPGPEWSYDIAACLSIIDSHDHSSGKGVPIAPNGMNINADLPFNGNNATLLRTTRFSAQGSPLASSSPDVGCLYVSGNELYFNDVSGGHQIQITTNGSVNAGAGSITGLPSGTASASFSAGTFVWQSATNTAANLDAGSIVLRNSTALSKALTLSPPAAMPANYGLTLPAVPGASGFMTLDNSGNMGATIPLSQGIQRTNLASVGQQISSSSGSFSTFSATFVDVTNLSVTITTSGRPVMLFLIGTDSGANSYIEMQHFLNSYILFVRDSTPLGGGTVVAVPVGGGSTNFVSSYAPGSYSYLDTPGAGTYTYKVQAKVQTTSGLINVINCALVAYEL